jgi:hypothetical protein
MAGESLMIALEGVLSIEDNKIDRHLAMYRGLATEFRTVVLTTSPREEAQRIMRSNTVRYEILLDKGDSVLTDVSWKVSQVREALGTGWPVGLYLDVDPDAVRQVYSMGVSSLLLTHHMLRPAWLPSNGPPRAWERLVALQQAQHDRTNGVQVDEVGSRSGGGWSIDDA